MIRLDIKPWCQECPNFEPLMDKHIMFTGAGELTDITICCEHKTQCEQIRAFLEGEDRIETH